MEEIKKNHLGQWIVWLERERRFRIGKFDEEKKNFVGEWLWRFRWKKILFDILSIKASMAA